MGRGHRETAFKITFLNSVRNEISRLQPALSALVITQCDERDEERRRTHTEESVEDRDIRGENKIGQPKTGWKDEFI